MCLTGAVYVRNGRGTIMLVTLSSEKGNRVDLEQALTRLVESATEELHIVRSEERRVGKEC